MSSTEGHHQAIGHNQIYETSHQSEVSNPESQRVYSQYRGGALPMGMYALPRDNTFPERRGQPECQYYMKTGDSKFGAVCRFHHPTERLIPAPDCKLSSLGLPLRQNPCVFSTVAMVSANLVLVANLTIQWVIFGYERFLESSGSVALSDTRQMASVDDNISREV